MPSRRPHRQPLPSRLLKRFMQALFRVLTHTLQGQRMTQAGFVFPTTVMLVLMVSLTAGALTYRAYSRSSQIIVQRQQQVVQNAATPAIDRAKAKLEYLFSRDTRPAPKVPPSDALENLMRATSANMLTGGNYTRLAIKAEDQDIYTLPDEDRVDLDGDGKADNAWVFNEDVDGDGNIADSEVVVYAILMDHLNNNVTFDDKEDDKAKNLVTRNSPLTAQASNPCVREDESGETQIKEEPISGEGWSRINTVKTEKTFQVVVFAADLSAQNVADTVSTLEFQQIREASLANKWGAWFRYDLEATPGPEFNWNGAMHTQGSLFINNNLNAYMISSTASCAHDQGASELTMGAENADTGYKGQLVFGSIDDPFRNENNQGPATIHVEDPANRKTPKVEAFGLNSDTVNGTAGATAVINQIYLDPIELHLNDVYKHIGTSNWARNQEPEANFPGRIRNISQRELVRISLDDTYRADDRYGPNKVYDRNEADGSIPSGTMIGTNIPSSNTLLTGGDEGLDGYWERRAKAQGLRLIVGQRLELGNANGWNYDPTTGNTTPNADPLYPPNALPTTRTGEHYQRRLLRDNLAAVQGMVVYHYKTGSGLTPAACIATTAHPGTYKTIANSRTYRKRIDTGNTDKYYLDFLTGNGTNGWQFDRVDPANTEVRKALTNLANFAGDPQGGAPSFTPVQDAAGATGKAHPFPYMAMWGNYSMLRRVLASGNGSIADQSTLDSAACTLGLLAYNLDVIEKEHATAKSAGFGGQTFDTLGAALANAYQGNAALQNSAASLDSWKSLPPAALNANQKLLLDIGWHHWVVKRDREFGFSPRGIASSTTGTSGVYDAANSTFTVGGTALSLSSGSVPIFPASSAIKTWCNPYDLKTEYGLTGTDADTKAVALAFAMCKGPHYPSLYYIFPTANHDGDGDATTVIQPPAEDYIAKTVEPAPTGYGQNNDFAVVNLTTVAATPKATTAFPVATFTATQNAAFSLAWNNDDNPDRRPWDLVTTNADGSSPAAIGVPLLDKVVYSGRENMPMRLLDINVEQLMTTQNGGDYWFAGRDSDGNERFGLTYAFREDAAREDSIVRPAAATFASCGNYGVYGSYASGTDNCYAKTAADVLSWTDPPLGTDHKISLKPVDFVPDPMRQPYGFRLREGADFNRANDVASGLTFISDNVVAIQGDFNLHTETSDLEEFSDITILDRTKFESGGAFSGASNDGDVKDDAYYTAFYDRKTTENKFANPANDKWRPAEILGDAVYTLSNAFVDGFVEAAYVANAAGESGTFQFVDAFTRVDKGSFQNMNRPADASNNVPVEQGSFYREARKADGSPDLNSPIYFDRNADVWLVPGVATTDTAPDKMADYTADTEEAFEYFRFLTTGLASEVYRQKNLVPAEATTINALIISGQVPTRLGQQNGGIHNFPRMEEFWGHWTDPTNIETLQISGGFFQLFFSTTATAPWDIEVWEYNQVPAGNRRNIGYYTPPRRVWGYDVALQFAQQPPISSRFVSVGTPRSEFYKELPVDDAYIKLLRCATKGGAQIDPNATCS